MALLITPAEVLETAFPATEQFRDDLIRPTMIEVAQLQYLQPVFGALFDALEEERYSDFVSTYIKPPLAYYIILRIAYLVICATLRRCKSSTGRPLDPNRST